jgi:hypothetical protein
MQVVDGLSPVLSCIDDKAKAFFRKAKRRYNAGQGGKETGKKLRLRDQYAVPVFFGQKKDVPRSCRIEISDSQNMVIFVDFF